MMYLGCCFGARGTEVGKLCSDEVRHETVVGLPIKTKARYYIIKMRNKINRYAPFHKRGRRIGKYLKILRVFTLNLEIAMNNALL